MDTSTAVDICYDCIKFWTDECCPREPSVRGSVKKKNKPARTIKVLQCSDFKPFPEEKGG